MSGKASEHLFDELQDLLAYFGREYEMSHSEAVGVLEMMKHKLAAEAFRMIEDEDGDEEEVIG